MWSLVHWKLVVTEGIHPFLTHDIYAPEGFNLAWATVIPGPALLMVPLTATVGPVVAYNLLALAAPALAALTAFLLCRELTRNGYAAVAGGYLFGFSSYVLGQTLNHVNLALVFLLPLAALLAVRHARGEISDRRYVVGPHGGAGRPVPDLPRGADVGRARGDAGARGRHRRRRASGAPQLVRTAVGAGVALVAMAVIVSPYLYFALAHPNPIHEGLQPETYVADVENLFFPTPVTWLFSQDFADVSARFAGNLTEQLAYTPLPLLIVFLCAAFAFRRTVAGRVLVTVAVVAFVGALGAHLTIGGIPSIGCPGSTPSTSRCAPGAAHAVRGLHGPRGRRAGVAVDRASGRRARGAGR